MTTDSEKLRATVERQREANDKLEASLGIAPGRSSVDAAEREVLRLARLVGRGALPGSPLSTQYHEAACRLVDADAGAVRRNQTNERGPT